MKKLTLKIGQLVLAYDQDLSFYPIYGVIVGTRKKTYTVKFLEMFKDKYDSGLLWGVDIHDDYPFLPSELTIIKEEQICLQV